MIYVELLCYKLRYLLLARYTWPNYAQTSLTRLKNTFSGGSLCRSYLEKPRKRRLLPLRPIGQPPLSSNCRNSFGLHLNSIKYCCEVVSSLHLLSGVSKRGPTLIVFSCSSVPSIGGPDISSINKKLFIHFHFS